MFSRFSEEAQKVLIEAKREMLDLKHELVGSEHVFLALLNSDNSFSKFMANYDIDYYKYKKKLIELVGTGKSENTYFLYTPLLKKIFEEAMLLSKEKGNSEVEIEDIVMASFEEEEGIGIKVLTLLGMNDDVVDNYYAMNIKREKGEKKKLFVEEFGFDLTLNAKSGRLDPVIGRDKEIKRVMEILCRKYKNNPLLVGPAGVGKTAIVEELARRIVEGNVPNKLKGMRIISVSLSSLVANTKYRGEFEERITKMLKELENEDNIILFIDEIHTIMGAGGAEGAIDAANIFKPALSRGNIKLIGATTLDEYKKTIEKDKAMERRFQKINVVEPNKEETLNILRKLKPVYEKYHSVMIDDDILNSIVELASRYIYNKLEPDRSIDILDDVCSSASLNNDKSSEKIDGYKLELVKLKKEKNNFLINDDFEGAFKVKKLEKNVLTKLNKIESNISNKYNKIKIDDVYNTIEIRTGIPVKRIEQSKEEDIYKLDKYLKHNIIGQDSAIDKIIKTTRKMKYFRGNRPNSFLFVGPSGCGKTRLATLYGKYMFNNIIRLDGSEYKNVESINKILGSPSGYVGYDDNKNKLEEVRNNPYSLILFDEIEKANKDVVNLFLQILDEGKITDNKGNIIRFDNCTIVMTSNLGFTQSDIGFVENDSKNDTKLKNFLSTELLNRIKNVIYFNKLNYNDIYLILKKKIKDVKSNINENIRFNKTIIDNIINDSRYLEFGARRIENTLEEYIDKYLIDRLAIKALKQIS